MPLIVALSGSYRKDGVVDALLESVLNGAAEAGAETRLLHLTDYELAFCRNCRSCLQHEAGSQRGRCVLADDLNVILDQLEVADGVALGAPVNFGDVNALTRQFLERCCGFGSWQWGKALPTYPRHERIRPAVLASASGAPTLIGRYAFRSVKTLRILARMLGLNPIGVAFQGGVIQRDAHLSSATERRATALGRRLAQQAAGGAQRRSIAAA